MVVRHDAVQRRPWWLRESGNHDNTTSPRPFERPRSADNGDCGWVDWHSSSGLSGYQDDTWSHGFFGIAPSDTVRLTVTTEDDRVRDVPITPWCGTYVTEVEGRTSTLTGYAQGDEKLGELQLGYPPGRDF